MTSTANAKTKDWKRAQSKRGNRLVVLLRESKLTQYQVADELGISQATVSNYLTAKNQWPEDFEQRFRDAVAAKKRGAA